MSLRLLVGGLALLTVAGASLGTTGCVGGNKGISGEDRDRLKPYILDAVPADLPHPMDVNFENKIHLIGYKIAPETAGKGQDVKITYYWRCDEAVDEGWQLFTHLKDDGSTKLDNLDYSSPIREKRNDKQILGPDRWEKGKVYVDELSYKVPDWVTGATLTLMPGIWKGDARLRILSGPSDNDNRALAGQIKTGLTPSAGGPTPNKDQHTSNDVPQINVMKLAAADKITIDGKNDEKAWGNAVSTGPFVDVGTGKPAAGSPVGGAAKLAWDDQNLYITFDVTETNIVGYFTDAKSQPNDFTVTGLPKDWTKDTVEIMTDPGPTGDNKIYYELQINPQNKVFHSQFDDYNSPKTDPNGPYGHEDWDPKVKSAVVVHGTMDKPDDQDTGYTVEAAIPWAAFAKAKSDTVNLPPKPGDVWRMDLYTMKNNGGVAWSPILGKGNFHRASRFGKVVWSTPGMAMAGGDAGAAMAAGAASDGGAVTVIGGGGMDGAAPAPAMGTGRRMHGMMPPRPAPPAN